jgi:pantoate--beta-alanine ligase
LAVIQQMVRDLNLDVTVIGCPIIREVDGLAKSSRNSYLSADERKAALVLSRALEVAKQMLADGEQDAVKIRNAISETIQAEPMAKIDYVELVDARTLQQVDSIERPVLVALAVYIGKTRLIDNFIIE